MAQVRHATPKNKILPPEAPTDAGRQAEPLDGDRGSGGSLVPGATGNLSGRSSHHDCRTSAFTQLSGREEVLFLRALLIGGEETVEGRGVCQGNGGGVGTFENKTQ